MAMNIELRNVKHFKAGSEETECFVADIWIDGKKAGDVRNDGHGGCNLYSPWELSKTLNTYAETLPMIKADIGTGEDFEYRPDADSVIGDILNLYLIKKDLKRLLAAKIVYTRTDKAGVFATKKLSADLVAKAARGEALPASWNAKQVLNALPFDEALKIYKATA